MMLRTCLLSLLLCACGEVTQPGDDVGDGGGQLAITVAPGSRFVRVGDQLVAPVTVTRIDVTGDVVVTASSGLGITIDPLTIAEGADRGDLIVHVDPTAAFARGTIDVTATTGAIDATASLELEAIGKPGDLDPTFGTAGTLGFAGSDKAETPAFAIAQGDKTLVWIALQRAPANGVLVVRFDRDGQRDLAFGTAGETFVDLTTIGVAPSIVVHAVVQPDGRVVIAGSVATGVMRTRSCCGSPPTA